LFVQNTEHSHLLQMEQEIYVSLLTYAVADISKPLLVEDKQKILPAIKKELRIFSFNFIYDFYNLTNLIRKW